MLTCQDARSGTGGVYHGLSREGVEPQPTKSTTSIPLAVPKSLSAGSKRHTFAYRVIRREVTADDRVRDKGNRRHGTLHFVPSRGAEPFLPDLTYSTYTRRYPHDALGPEEERKLGEEVEDPVDPDEEADYSDTDREEKCDSRGIKTSQVATKDKCSIDKPPRFTIDAKEANLKIEQGLLIQSKGKLDSKIIDLAPDEASMSQEEIRTHEHVCRILVEDMKDHSTTLGKIVKEIAEFPNIGRPVKDLQDLFVECANIIAARVAGSRSGVQEEQQESSSVFRSLGSINVWPSESFEEVSVNAKMKTRSPFCHMGQTIVKTTMVIPKYHCLLVR